MKTPAAFPLIGRSQEQAALRQALSRVCGSQSTGRQGGVLLIAGEAGIGKTQMLEHVLGTERLRVLRGPSREARSAAPYSPIAAVLRVHLASAPDLLLGAPLTSLLGLDALDGHDFSAEPVSQTSFLEALRLTFGSLAEGGPAAVLLEDLQWADHATLDLLPTLADWLADSPVLIVGTYRQEELPRLHPLRRIRQELRRAGALLEIRLEPLGEGETAVLAGAVAGGPLAPGLAKLIYGRTEGVPLFICELARALVEGGKIQPGQNGLLGLSPGAEVEVPLTLRDTILLGLDRLPPAALAAAETAAVLGPSFGANVLLDLIGNDVPFDLLTESGLIVAAGEDAAFRHGLIREAVYAGVPWARRRTLHRQIAARLEALGAPPHLTAEHWLAGHEPERARGALLAAAEASCRLHAYRDAALSAGRALELWPAGVDEQRRLEVLDQLGQCAQACGLLPEAGRAWREAAQARRAAGDLRGGAQTQRKLAGTLELQGLWEQAAEARRVAAEAFAACQMPGEAAVERLALGTHLRAAGSTTAALEVLDAALQDARLAGRRDLEARILGQQGNALARAGQIEAGLHLAREGLSMAVSGNFQAEAVEVMNRLADTLEHAGDYAGARAAYQEAIELCEVTPGDGQATAAAQACRACLTVPLYQNGAWDQVLSECRAVLASADVPAAPRAAAGVMLGTVLAHRGQPLRARPALQEALALGRQQGVAAVLLRAPWGLALLAEAAGQPEEAAAHIRALLEVWDGIEDHYHVLSPLRWASSFFALSSVTSAEGDLRRSVNTLSRAAHLNGGPVAFSALAHALGELAWSEGQHEAACRQFKVAVDLFRDTDIPFEEASTRLRAGQLHALMGNHVEAVAQLVAAHRAARTLNAAALAQSAAQALQALGEPVERRGARTPPDSTLAGLTQRQLEVLRLLAQGRSDKGIAHELRLSPRTVEMHVGRILASLGSRSRTEAAAKAADLGLLVHAEGPG
jgi:DNA-binding CsgD family transcriptional regulator